MHIRAGDMVQVLTGIDRGERAKVLRIDHLRGKAVVEGVNRVWKHVRPSQKNPRGGRLSKEMPIDLSNIMLVCEACNEAVRTGVRFDDEGAKLRYCKSCGASIGQLAPPHVGHAKH